MLFSYLDPGSGSMITQALVAGVAGAAVVARLGWRRISSVRKTTTPEPATPKVQPGDE